MSEIALRFLLANLAAAGAIMAVLVLRKPARTLFGASLAYALWLLVPLAAFASLVPPRIVEIIQPAPEPGPAFALEPLPAMAEPSLVLPAPQSPTHTIETATPAQPLDPWALGSLAWIAGALAMLAWQLRNQSRFMADAHAGFAGPAVAGFIRPRIVTPADFEQRFDEPERQMILAHERIHLSRNDARINALAALVRCLCWFNPLIHLATHLMRIDQELACDAVVARNHPKARAVYASALLKAQLAARPLPLGCYWPARSEHPLTERIEMLKQAGPGRLRRIAGIGMLGLLAAGAGFTAWAAMPPEQRILEAPALQSAIRLLAPPSVQMPRYWTVTFNADDPVILKGKVIRFERDYDLMGGAVLAAVWIEADRVTSIGGDWPAPTAQTKTWRVAAGSPERWPDWAAAQIVGQEVVARGYRGFDRTCKPACLASSPDWAFPGLPALQPFADVNWAEDRDDPQPPAPAPQGPQTMIQPQMTISAPPATTTLPPLQLKAGDHLYLRGKIERIDFRDTSYVAFLRASSAEPGYGPEEAPMFGAQGQFRLMRENTSLWELSPTALFGDPAAIKAELLEKPVEASVTIINSGCKPTCKVKLNQLLTSRSSEVPEPTAGASIVSEFGFRYNTTQRAVARGTVERVKFHDRVFDAYIRTVGSGFNPGGLVQARSEYTLPRPDIEQALIGQTVIASGWRARENIATFCEPVCGMYASSFEFPDRSTLTPLGDRARTPSPYLQRPRGQLFVSVADLNAPVTLRGKILRYVSDPSGENPQLWIEASSASPETTDGSKAGTIWVVAGFPFEPHETYDPTDSTRDLRSQAAQATAHVADLVKRYAPNHPEMMKANQEKAALEARIADQLWVGKNVVIRGFNVEDKRCQPQCMLAGDSIAMGQ